ncbi:hypothetical protein IBG24_07475 [Aeromicrobium sp. zg-636]|uniref:DUF2530 domain-containing protein n=1 Tax=Aeromicrobium senzhongii TaxID=2663859 RepID=A0A8I0K2Q3_9ACTN|nr:MULTISPECIES: hypothetical protein [Aeromicrobium]MBC9226150.1 hypothetical protein [Aeromicrobium senzhongii]
MARTKKSRIPDLGRPEVTELEFGRTTHRVADVEPMDVDGVRTMTIGTIGWGIVAIALLPFWGNLQEQGRTWWLWTAIAGLGLGLMGIEFCKRRRDALLERQAEAPEAKKTPEVTTTPRAAKAAKPAKPAKAPRAEKTRAPRAQQAEVAPPAESSEPTERPIGRRRRN